MRFICTEGCDVGHGNIFHKLRLPHQAVYSTAIKAHPSATLKQEQRISWPNRLQILLADLHGLVWELCHVEAVDAQGVIGALVGRVETGMLGRTARARLCGTRRWCDGLSDSE